MRYKILCLATGDCVKLENLDIFKYCDSFVKEAANTGEIARNIYNGGWQPVELTFATEAAADWFKRRRLCYNPRRTISRKLATMDAVFTLNGINPLSNKIEYDILEIPDE